MFKIEEASAEEEELLGKNSGGDLEDGEEGEEGVAITRDEELLRVLDRMIFYLRMVHSIDFYNHSEYPNEDEMPNRWVALGSNFNATCLASPTGFIDPDLQPIRKF